MPRTRLASGASLALAPGAGWVGQDSNLAEDRGLRLRDILTQIQCVPGCCGQTKCSAESEGETGVKKLSPPPTPLGRVAVKVHITRLQSAVSYVTLLPRFQFVEVFFSPAKSKEGN